MTRTTIVIRAFESRDARAVADLNRAWLDQFNLREPIDDRFLADPAGEVIVPGGAIFIAEIDGRVAGTCAIAPHDDAVFEIVKLAVAPEAKGRGIGRQLIAACLSFARGRGARRAVLVSNSQLTTAIRIYEQMGFVHRPLPPDQPYLTADVYMERDVESARDDGLK